MWVSHLSLSNFRNYTSAEIDLNPGFNLFLGANGQGKTNAIEAIAYFTNLSSHRVSQDQALIRTDCESAIVRMRVQRSERETLLEFQLNKALKNRAQINKSPAKPRQLTENFSTVVFAPEDLQIVRGEPSVRRKFLDQTQTLRNPHFSALISEYEKVVKQRNALLKTAKMQRSQRFEKPESIVTTLEIWDARLVELGVKIWRARIQLLHELKPFFENAYQQLTNSDHQPSAELITNDISNFVELSDVEIQERFWDALNANRASDFARAQTSIGPHRDDLELSLNALPVKGYASHGETWSFVLAMRLAVAELLKKESTAGDPVLILDDVFAELDKSRRDKLFCAAQDFEQTIVTAAVADDVPKNINWHVVHIQKGEVIPGEVTNV